MADLSTDIAIVGAGMAGASLAAAIGARARVLLLEAEAQPGYHSTGRSAAFWSESYGGPAVQPLTSASGAWLEERGFLSPRGCLHVAESPEPLDDIAAELAAGGIAAERLGRAGLDGHVTGLRPAVRFGVWEPSCHDIDVAALHAYMLGEARRAGAVLRCDSAVTAVEASGGGWELRLRDASVRARLLVDAAGAWAGAIAAMAGAAPIPIQPFRRTLVQLAVDPPVPSHVPLVMDARGGFYFKPEAGGRLWLSPHDESAVTAHDVAPEELDQAEAIDRLERTVDWRVVRRERAWAGLRSFAPDRAPVYGFDRLVPGFFWCAGQGGFGIQTAPAAAALAAALLLETSAPPMVAHVDASRYAPDRFAQAAG